MAADAPVLEQLNTLDLGAGNLQDSGGEALLKSERAKTLNKLDLTYHFLSDEMMERFEDSDLSYAVEMEDQQQPDDWGSGEMHYYISIGE